MYLKRKAIHAWICMGVGGILFFGVGLLTGFDGWFPYMHVFNAFSVAVWCVTFYFILEKKLTKRLCAFCLATMLVTALPHILGCFLTYGSWACLAVSAAMIIFLAVDLRKAKRNEK